MTQGTEKRIRSRHLTIRLAPEERAAIEAAAEHAGLTPGSYARRVLLGAPAPREVRRRPAERQELARLLGELGKIGGNLNQLAYQANIGNFPVESEIRAVLAELVRLMNENRAALGQQVLP